MSVEALAVTPAQVAAPGGAYLSDPSNATIVMGGSVFDGAPHCPGATITVHALGDRTTGQLIYTEVIFPAGQRSWFHTHHREDEGFHVLEGQLTLTVIDDTGQRHALVTNPGEFVWGPQEYPHSFHITSDVPCKAIIVLTPGSSLTSFFGASQSLQLDHTDKAAVAAFVEETNRLYGTEFFPEIPLDV
ncbi:cupin domain-containing protein [Mycobacteroides abscessus]|uniref:Cupin domain-containing protein n=1 Tax=Mycobacteroides abscessus TaxID=36809 RepID=A0ABD7HFX2_9MYCO|nr:cupin domain-containing protein [Mycobacteroides abscessus]RIR60956.1 cupin domain-containing protein [Mycobacteroides abscessus]RIR98008.1 cupin domain-containing protein [Mycobacteroides abscessus]RIS71447.1 cupin domain-containing protein [Mycobacteroides abscessus]RIS80320.1 cupin domain-containing protein [Mycobacteroides abscessus]RIT28078.1 cupin domain-containing protein [Mycobacteroides abscessus]